MFKSVTIAAVALSLVPALTAQAQHRHSPYAGMETVEGTALTVEEMRQLRTGEGMGLAIAAELNHYPGPRHVLDMRTDLGLSTDQVRQVEAIYEAMHTEAVRVGDAIIVGEARLAAGFRDTSATAEQVRELTAHLGSLRGQLQAIHLNAHVATRAVLTPEQIEAYDTLRGYAHSRHQERHPPQRHQERHRP